MRAEPGKAIVHLPSDLRQTELRFQKEIEEVLAELKTDVYNVLIWLTGMLGFQTLVVVGAIIGALSMML